MKASIQNKIAPPEIVNKFEFNKIDVKNPNTKAVDSTSPDPEIDFKSLLKSSNDEVREKREAIKNGDLSKAGNDQDLISMLNDPTKKQRVPKNTLGKDDFLKLFVAQLQNQDPLQPRDNSELAAQLAQFNSLEQMLNVNKNLEKMSEAQKTSRNMALLNYLGKEVSVNNGITRLNDGKIGDTSFSIERAVSEAHLEIRNSDDQVVGEKPLGNLDAGTHKLDWDGKNSNGETLSDGIYQFRIKASNVNGESIPVSIRSQTKVTGVDLQKGKIHSDAGKIDPEQISAVGQPGFTTKS